MSDLVADVLAILESAARTGVLDDSVAQAIPLTGDLIAKSRSPHYESGMPNVDATVVTSTDGRRLEEVVLSLLRDHPQSPFACGLMWALGKSGDPSYVEEYVALLERGSRLMTEGNKLIFQALCNLDRAGLNAFERDDTARSSQSISEPEMNLRQARAYLAKRGVLIPW